MEKWMVLIYVMVLLMLLNVHVYAALAFFLLTLVIANAYIPQLKGYVGEKRVERMLRRLGKRYRTYHNVYLPKSDGQLTQVDHIVTSQFGVFVIETKNYAGDITGKEEERYWTQRLHRTRTKFYSPVFQNKAHVEALQHMMAIDVPLYSIIVFSNEATLKLATEQTAVIQLRHLRTHIQQYEDVVINDEQLAIIDEVLRTSVTKTYIEKRRLKKRHLQQLRTYRRKKRKLIVREGECPTCGQPLVERKGKFGKFYGCSAFPRCRFTKPMKE